MRKARRREAYAEAPQGLIRIAPVDSGLLVAHSAAVNKKPHKVEEAATPYTAKQPVKAVSAVQSGPRYAPIGKVRASNVKLLQVHRVVLQKLAQ